MKKLQFVMKNKIMIAVMVVVMAFGISTVPVDAAAVTTNIISASSGHTLYVKNNRLCFFDAEAETEVIVCN